ncbi:hypothetical protein NX059_009168 [Plenodomus lindquistii]|nr:hypothetical protein NX059_009168 [Plenodomus lindquistii]
MSDTDRLLWLAYCKTIQDEIGPLGNNHATFFSTRDQKGPLADPLPEPYTNNGIHEIANQRLRSDDMFYEPSKMFTYTDTLIS